MMSPLMIPIKALQRIYCLVPHLNILMDLPEMGPTDGVSDGYNYGMIE